MGKKLFLTKTPLAKNELVFFQYFFLPEEIYGFNLCLSLYKASMMLPEKEKIFMNVFFSNKKFCIFIK